MRQIDEFPIAPVCDPPNLERVLQLIEQAVEAIETLRGDGAHVHCITNTVAQYFTANVLLACGASPSMTASAHEAPEITRHCGSLLVNTGMLDPDRRDAILRCVDIAAQCAKPVVVDPVKCDLSAKRLAFVRQLLAPGHSILKANASEAKLLSDLPVLCRITTGPVDVVEYNGTEIRVLNGTPLLDRTIATGCALGSLVAALNAVVPDPQVSAVAALLWFGICAEVVAENGTGPGSFPVALIDALAGISTAMIRQKARLE